MRQVCDAAVRVAAAEQRYWRGFRGTGSPQPYPDLPGEWAGPDYDYVAADELPADVQGCLNGS